MELRRTIVLIVVGGAAGALLTSLVFLILNRETTSEAESLDAKTVSDQSELSFETDNHDKTFTRNINGECVFFGQVTTANHKPIPEASLSVWLLDQPWADPGPGTLGKTDEKGGFTLSGIDVNIPVLLYAAAPGYALAFLENPACGEALTLVMEKGGHIEIAVSDEKGKSIENAEILVAGDNLWPPRVGRSAPGGKLRIDGLREGEYAVWALFGNRSAATTSPVLVSPDKGATVSLSLLPKPPTKLRVLDAEDQQVLEDVTVVVSPRREPLLEYVRLTGKDGRVAVPCPDSEGCLFLAGESGFVDEIPVAVPLGGTKDVYLKAGGTISGVVSDKGGEPVQGARLMVNERVGGNTVSLFASDGRMFSQMLLGTASVGWPRMIAVKPDTVNIGPATIPVPKRSCPECSEEEKSALYWASTDEQGRFSLAGLPSRQLTLHAVHPEMVMVKPWVAVDLTDEQAVSGVSIAMRRGSHATIRVVDERGIPITGASVFLLDKAGGRIRDSVTDNDGYVDHTGLPGYFKIEASQDGYVSAVSKVDSRVGSELELEMKLNPADKILTGRVSDKNGFGLGGVAVVARSIDRGTLHVVTGVTESDGTFSLEGVGRGSYGIAADGGEMGGARVSGADYREEIKLVLVDNIPMPESGPTIIEPGARWPEAALKGPNAAFGSEVDRGDTANLESADDLGVTSGYGSAAPEESVSTRFGFADELPVTGPPTGKGGLPIQIGGGSGNALVTKVASGSRVETAGLTKGCRIIAVDGQKVLGPADAKRAISGTIGSVVMLEVLEPGNPAPFTIVVQRIRVN